MSKEYKWAVLGITTLGSLMTPLGGSIVNVAVPSITVSLGIDFNTAVWIPTTYLLLLSTLLLSFGRLSDIRGRRTLFIWGFLIFTFASALSGVSQNGAQLIASMAAQGIGAALIGSTSLAILASAFPSEERGRVIGINAMAVYIGLSAGPSLGGFLVQSFGWRSAFYVNVPIGFIVLLLSALRLKEPNLPTQRQARFDPIGSITLSIGLACLLLALTLGSSYGWYNLLTLTFFSISGFSFAVFFITELRMGDDAVFDVSLLLRNRLFAASNLSALLNYISFYGVSFFMSIFLQRVLKYPPAYAGMVLLSMPATMALLSPISGWLSDRFGSQQLSSLGMAVMCLGLLLLTSIDLSSTPTGILARLFVLGLGMGLFSSPNTSAVMGSVRKEKFGIASATLSTMRFVGQSLSLALMGTIMSMVVPSDTLTSLLSGGGESLEALSREGFIKGLRIIFTVAAIISGVGIITSLLRGNGWSEE